MDWVAGTLWQLVVLIALPCSFIQIHTTEARLVVHPLCIFWWKVCIILVCCVLTAVAAFADKSLNCMHRHDLCILFLLNGTDGSRLGGF